jgi:alpha-tubulin suppressor-like RCC1 family protein
VLAAGEAHACRIADGTLSCWGANNFGQIGADDNTAHTTPIEVPQQDGKPWTSVAAGRRHTCGLREPGALYCWGDNSFGQLGVGNTIGTSSRPRASSERWEDFIQLRCGGDNCCALRRGGALFCWGTTTTNNNGAMPVTRPTQVEAGTLFLPSFSVGAAGHSCAIRSDRALLCWGRNNEGQLGQGSDHATKRRAVVVGERRDWLRVATGREFTCAIAGESRLFCWGANQYSQLGLGREALDGAPLVADLPTMIDNSTDWAEIAAGGGHACGLKFSHELRCWGRGESGQLGIGVVPVVEFSVAVPPARIRWQSLALAGDYSCGRAAPDDVYCWGDNSDAQLGLGDSEVRSEPTLVSNNE